MMLHPQPIGSLVYEASEFWGVLPRFCMSTTFRSLTSGAEFIGYGLRMGNPKGSGHRVVGAVAGGVSITGPGQSNRDEWFAYSSDTLPRAAVSTQYVEAAAASPDGTRLAVVSQGDASGDRAVGLLSGGGLGQPVTPACAYKIRAAAARVAWARWRTTTRRRRQPRAPPPLTGTITDADTGATVPGAMVILCKHADSSAQTHANDQYTLAQLAPGTYPSLLVFTTGYDDVVKNSVSAHPGANTIDLATRRGLASAT